MHISKEGRQASELGEGRLSRVLAQQRECLLRDRLGVCAQVLGLLLLGFSTSRWRDSDTRVPPPLSAISITRELALDFLVRQGGLDDYTSVSVLLSLGRFLEQGD